MPDVRPEGFSPHRSVTGIILISPISGLLGPFSFLFSSSPRFYIGWNQPPLTSRCLMLMQDDHLPTTSW